MIAVYYLAGIVGCDPGPLTLRELVAMVDGFCSNAWDHTSTIIATIINSNPYIKTKVSPFDFHPYKQQQKQELPKADISILRTVFCKDKNKGKRK